MTLLIIADDDSVLRTIPSASADMLISCGDLPDDVILQIAAACRCREALAAKGNHDSSAGFASGIRDLQRTTFNFRGLRFGGFCGSWKYEPKGNYPFEQTEVEQALLSF